LGLRTTIYPAANLTESTAWFTGLLGIEPYFVEEFYVGYRVNGYELALDPNADPEHGPITYWGVADADAAYRRLLAAGAVAETAVSDVGDAIRAGTVRLPHGGGLLGVIENPHFAAVEAESSGPGR